MTTGSEINIIHLIALVGGKEREREKWKAQKRKGEERKYRSKGRKR